MPIIDRENNVTLSGVTLAGLQVDINDPIKIGSSVAINIDGTQRRLDLTTLAGGDYPMDIILDARGAGCVLAQGDSGVLLDTVNYRLQADDWADVTVSGVAESYIAVQQEDVTFTGLLVATRQDKLP